ncbi:hypothetical protein AMECASPLE_010171 [Ameca splendens]|uniref:Uncharacterized protein n=1 Tax=Ameca splendens TaxID=208324 RepID=A0ABV0ZLI2_9TELE
MVMRYGKDRKNEIPAKMSFLQRVARLSLRDRVRSSVILAGDQIRAPGSPYQKESADVVLASDQDASWVPPFGDFLPLERNPEEDRKLAGGTVYPVWPGNAFGYPKMSWRMSLGRGMSGDMILNKQKTMDKSIST